MKPISTSEATSPVLKIDKKLEIKEKNIQQGDKQAHKNYKFCLFNGNNSVVFRKILLSRGNWEEIKESQIEEKSIFQNSNFIWKSYNFSVRKYAIIEDIHRNNPFKQIINHFENNRGMCTKTGLIRSLSSYYRHLDPAIQAKYTVFDTCATSFVLTAGINDVEFTSFMSRYNEIAKGNFIKEKVPKKHCLENIWLLKPADANQGRGIEILKTQKDIISSLVQKQCNSYWVIQKYIEKPLLYHGRKFDIRIWVLVTKSGEIFIYKPGYIRTCCDEYNMQDIDVNLHLTNNFVQKHHQNYGQHEPGNTLPLECLFEYIDQKFANENTEQVNLRERIHQRMKDLIIDTILSVKKSMITIKRYNNFELFGYDFLIDEDLRVWLIEVNTNPYIGIPNDFIKELVPRMADDLVKIAVDPLFPPQNPPESQNNDFELIYCENGSSFNNGNPKNVRQPFSVSPYPLQKLAQKPNKVQRQYGTSLLFNNVSKPQLQSEQNNSQDENQVINTSEVNDQTNQQIKQRSASAARISQNNNKGGFSPNFSVVERNAHSKSPESRFLSSNLRSGSAQQIKMQQLDKQTLVENDSKKKLERQKTVEEQDQEDEQQLENLNQNINENILQQTKLNSNNQSYDPDLMFYNLKKLLNTYLYADFQPFYQHINNILSKMMNWELMSEQELKVVVKTLRFILESRISNILVDQKYIEKLISVIDSQNHPIEIQEVSLEALCTITKNVSNKVRIVSKNIILLLIKISLSSCDEKEMEKYDRKIRILATNCLIHLGGIYNRRQYIPGETRDNDKIRRLIIENGGLLALLWIRKKVNDNEIKKISQDFIDNLDISDFELQYNLVKKWRKALFYGGQMKQIQKNQYSQESLQQCNLSGELSMLQEKIKEENGYEDSKGENVSSQQNDNALQKKTNTFMANINQIQKVKLKNNNEPTPEQYPVFLQTLDYFDFQGSMDTAEDIYLTIKEQIIKRDKEDKLKKEMEVKKQQQQEDERKLQLLERKAKVEEFQKKKEEEKLKRKLEEKRREEKQKEILAQEEKKRQQKYEEMQKRREELRRFQKMEEDRRKFQDDDGQRKNMEISRLKRYLAPKLLIEDPTSKQQIDFINSRNLFIKSKENDQSNLLSTIQNQVNNFSNRQNQTQNNSFLAIKVSNSRQKLASLSNRNIPQSPTLLQSSQVFSDSIQLLRHQMKNQFTKDDNLLKQSNKIIIKSPNLAQSQQFANTKYRNQRQLSPIKVDEVQSNGIQEDIQEESKQANQILLENQENMSASQQV
ncbi:tubulin-tyrosine ligase family protein (macronuclear) [Tetrahymena thermophila SB210]|uniref:Tubulin-tyrosine ligase family protein n=1 Tax=Tetrahymena thermophila (strain SB210) TaxID=312017 RepID=I7MIF8_TETTS|nr:tubulin-tyrosine ligase family protein [Tetrahymena thermophila SB210]EAR92967.2 tubulin-tyrosine ligase family protein [Tetrahymena thermophila SB210]|eukprot:XP_001013212.2 tubulin-tyrosine ligase family protein [Tetrahymena thermophila SB210]